MFEIKLNQKNDERAFFFVLIMGNKLFWKNKNIYYNSLSKSPVGVKCFSTIQK